MFISRNIISAAQSDVWAAELQTPSNRGMEKVERLSSQVPFKPDPDLNTDSETRIEAEKKDYTTYIEIKL